MKFIILLIGIIALQSCEKKSLNEKEILEIIHSNEEYKNLELKTDFSYGYDYIDSIKSFKKTVDREDFKPYHETDFNYDGKKDYLVNLRYPVSNNDDNVVRILAEDDYKNTLVILSSTNGYQLLNPGKQKVHNIISAKTMYYKGQNLIKLINFKKHIKNRDDMLQYDTLMIKNNELTEFTISTNNHHIEKITFTQNDGYTPGRIYNLTFKKDSIFLQSDFYKNLKGKYIGVDSSIFKNLSKYLNEINFSDLKDNYSIECSDCSSVETEIIFNNGKSKKIYDYGEKGTLSLLKFYEKIDKIINDQKWKKIDGIYFNGSNNRF